MALRQFLLQGFDVLVVFGDSIMQLLADTDLLILVLKFFLKKLLINFFAQINFWLQFLILLIKLKNIFWQLKCTFTHGLNRLVLFLNLLDIFFELLDHLVFGLDQPVNLLVQIFYFFSEFVELVLNAGNPDKTFTDVLKLGIAHFFTQIDKFILIAILFN